MGRKPKLTWEQASGILDMHTRGMGTRRIAKVTRLARALVRRILDKWNPKAQKVLPGGSPQLALPLEQPHETRAIPPAQEIAAPIGKCPVCGKGKVALVFGLGICSPCIEREKSTYHGRPIAFGRCWRCAADRPIHMMTTGGEVFEGLCGAHKVAELSSAIAQARAKPRQPERDSRGMYWDEDGAGGRGCWKL